ncbi:MAG: ATP-grasp domain-containing protein, partial [Planctomycetota bacterium]
MRPLTILRTGAGSLPSPPVIEGLRSLGCRVIAADVDPVSVGFTCADSWRPIPRANAPAFGASILSLCREERVDAILPAVNEEIPRLADIREELEGRGTALIAPTAAAIEVCLDKALTTQALRGLDVPTPEIWDPAQGTAALEGVRFPALIKPRSGRGSRGIRRLRDREELSFHLARAGEPVVVQRWV